MPFHILLSTWFGTSLGILEFAKVFKDIVLVFGFLLVMVASWRQPWFKPLAKDRLLWLIDGYVVLTLLMALIKPTDQDAEILAVVYNLRFLMFFIYGLLLAKLFAKQNILRTALKTVLAVAAVVLTFGIVQYLLLPDNALAHVGYARGNGVLPAFFIDDKPDLERIMSTMRDPNSFGSYVIIIMSLSLSFLLLRKDKNFRQIMAGMLGLSVLCLWFTFSRSAWLGALLAVIVTIVLVYRKNISRKFLWAGAGIILFAALLLIPFRNTYFVQNTILHADESTVLEDPNQLRVRFWRESLNAAAENPLGYGPGTAGLPSVRNDLQGTILNENYYLQILHETGIIGFLLFLSILVVVAKRLFEISKNNPVVIALLASFAGLAITNFLVHIWANEAVAYTWWGLAGLVIFIDRK